jgi:hypothetical protein
LDLAYVIPPSPRIQYLMDLIKLGSNL